MKNLVVARLVKVSLLVALFVPMYSFSQNNGQFAQNLYGIVSIYNDQMDGQRMASGLTFSQQSLVASHRTLPFGTRVELENLSNGKKVEVVIRDRGPIELNRIMDVSQQVAEILGFTQDKTTFVKATVLEVGNSLPDPEVEKPVGQDIPQDFVPEPPAPAATPLEEEPVLNELALEEPQARAQEINSEIVGFEELEDFIVDDPLSNMVIGPDDEFVAEPPMIFEDDNISIDDALILHQANDDPFADLFNDNSDPFSFQSVIEDNVPLSPPSSVGNIEDLNIKDENSIEDTIPYIQTNVITVTNMVDIQQTNIVDQTNMQTDPSFNMENGYHDAPTPINPSIIQSPTMDHYIIQLGAFSNQKNALGLYSKLRKDGFNAYIMDIKVKGQNLIRVRVGYFQTLEEAVNQSDRLRAEYSLDNRVIKVEYEK